MTEKMRARVEEIGRQVEENSPALEKKAPQGDPAVLHSVAKYKNALERLAEE